MPYLDLVTVTAQNSTDDGYLEVTLGNGDGTFAPERVFSDFLFGGTLLLADFNGDGHLDLAQLDSDIAGRVGVQLGRGDGTFELRSSWSSVGFSPSDLLAADFDQEGRLDLAVANYGAIDVSILRGLGDGTFAPERRYAVGLNPFELTDGDFNGDGRADLVATEVNALRSNAVAVLVGFGDGTFVARRRVTASQNPKLLPAGDFNGDDRPDLVTVNWGAPDDQLPLSFLLGNGDGTFGAAVPQHLEHFFPASQTSGDFNGDGRLDLATLGFDLNSRSQLQVLLGDGDGTFTVRVVALPGPNLESYELVAGDFDQDGQLDLMGMIYAGHGLVFLRGNGDGTFTRASSVRMEASLANLIVGDFDQDGRLDLAAQAAFEPFVHEVTIFLGRGDGTFRKPRRLLVGEGDIRALASGDFNRDGWVDLVTVNNFGPDGPTLSVFLSLKKGNFAPEIRLTLGLLNEVSDLAVQDFDGDGQDDLALAIELQNQVWVLTSLGDGTFASGVILEVSGENPWTVVTADFNGDARPDLATANFRSDDLSIFLGTGAGTFLPADQLAPNPPAAHPRLADLTGDGIIDLVIVDDRGRVLFREGLPDDPLRFAAPQVVGVQARDVAVVGDRLAVAIGILSGLVDRPTIPFDPPDGSGGLSFALNGPEQNFHDESVVVFSRQPDGNWMLTDFLTTGLFPAHVVSGDLDGDGAADLAVVNLLSQDVSIFLNRGDNFLALDRIPVGAGPADIALVDVDGDNRPDLVIPNAASGDVSVLHNLGGGMFEPFRYRAGSGPYGLKDTGNGPVVDSLEQTTSLATGDFTSDGRTDLAVYNLGTGRLELLVGTPGGGFTAPQPGPKGLGSALLRAAFLDGDHYLDLAVLDRESGRVIVLRGHGDGTFEVRPGLEVANNPTGLTIRDVDNDGVADLVLGNGFGDPLFLLGQGDGTFRSPASSNHKVPFAVADLNGDGLLDVIVANQAQDRVTVYYRQRGLAAFAPGEFLQGRPDGVRGPGQVQLRDLNRDGAADLIVANGGRNNVLIYLGLGNGQFGPEVRGGKGFAVGANPTGLQVAHLNDDNSDGRINRRDFLDIVVVNRGSDDVSVLFGKGRGADWTLTAGPRLEAGPGPVAVTIRDVAVRKGQTVNGVVVRRDGVPDLIVTNGQDGTFTVLPGIGRDRGTGFFRDNRSALVDLLPGVPVLSQPPVNGFVLAEGGSLFQVNFSTFTARRLVTSNPQQEIRFVAAFRNGLVAAFADGSVSRLEFAADGDLTETPLLTDERLADLSQLEVVTNEGLLEIYATLEGEELPLVFSLAGGLPVPDQLSGGVTPVGGSGLTLVATLLLNVGEDTNPTATGLLESTAEQRNTFSGLGFGLLPVISATFDRRGGLGGREDQLSELQEVVERVFRGVEASATILGEIAEGVWQGMDHLAELLIWQNGGDDELPPSRYFGELAGNLAQVMTDISMTTAARVMAFSPEQTHFGTIPELPLQILTPADIQARPTGTEPPLSLEIAPPIEPEANSTAVLVPAALLVYGGWLGAGKKPTGSRSARWPAGLLPGCMNSRQ